VGALDFDENSHPSHGLLQGGAKLDMNQPNRQVQGSSPTARLTFDGAGQLSQAHMEQGVVFNSQQQGTNAKGVALQLHRTWKSQSADVVFSPAPSTMPKNGLKSQVGRPVQEGTGSLSPARVEPRTIRGYGGVVVTSESTSGGVTTPSRLAADTVVVELAPGGSITSLVGNGRAIFEDQTAAGVHQASSADQLEISFLPAITKQGGREIKPTADKSRDPGAGAEIASVVEIGHVVLLQEPPSGHSASNRDKAGVRATSSRADYDGPSQILHLTGTPRVQDGALDLTANRIDLARATGDAFAHGDVRASWVGSGTGTVAGTSLLAGTGSGGNGPVHAIAEEAELRQSTQEVIFRMGGNAQSGEPRMWQSVNSVTAPVITLNRQKQTLTAEANGVANPVKTVLVSNASVTGSGSSKGTKPEAGGPSVIRVRSGELHYSEGERLALFHSGSLGSVTAETTGANGESTIVSREAEVKLASAGTHFASVSSGAVSDMVKSPGASNASVDRLTASGHVVVDWPNHRGTGERLVYLSDDGNFTLTGTSTVPPRITDQAQSSVTGSALIYHSRDGSVTVEGDGGRTQTETRSKK
jgi:lipopolysaccharide export system protein LptA